MAECGYMVRFQAGNYGSLPNSTEAKALIDAALAAQPHFESTCVSVEAVYDSDPPEDQIDGQIDLFN